MAEYGGFWIRFLALLADSAILFVAAMLVIAAGNTALGMEGMGLAVWVVWLIYFLYWPVMHASARQATFGKAILGLKVTRAQGGRISILRSFGRELAKIVSSAVFMVGFIMAAFTGHKQGLHDLMASTYVVRAQRARVLPALAVAVAGFALPVVLIPMLIGGAAVSMMNDMMVNAVMSQPDPMKQAAKPAAPVPPKVAAKPQAPAPVQTAQAPAPASAAPAKAQEAKAAEAAKPAATTAQVSPVTPLLAEPKAEEKAKPKPAPGRVARVATQPKPAPAFEPKVAQGPKFNDLMTAVLYRDAEGLTELLKMGKWADKPDSRGVTPLMVAAELGDARTAAVLLRAGADASLAIPVAQERRDSEMLSLLKRYTR